MYILSLYVIYIYYKIYIIYGVVELWKAAIQLMNLMSRAIFLDLKNIENLTLFFRPFRPKKN